MGEVFVSAKPGPVGFGPYVALKVLRDELASDQTFVDMLVDEANISMFLNHQNVVSVLDLGADDGAYYIAMEYVQGITVERLAESTAARGHKLAVPVGLHVGAELCRALKYAHTRVNHQGEPLNIVHRDVTPANILLSTQGEVKLTDFGIARAKGRVHQTQAGVLKGKFGYMAPEMVRYERIDARADLFCAGVCLYLMLSGQHPVAGAAVMEAIQRYEEKRIPPPSTINPEISSELDAIVMRCLEPKVDNRWSTAEELGDVLRDVMLKNPAWRVASNDGARLIAQQLRGVAPEVFDAPVSSEQSQHLLERARADRAHQRASVAPVPLGQDRLEQLKPRIPSAAVAPAHEDPATEDGGGYGSPGKREELRAQDLVELPTATSLPAISPEMDFGATPAMLAPERETDEQLSLQRVEQARQSLNAPPDTDEQNAGPTDDRLDVIDDDGGAVASAPADATVSTPVVSAAATADSGTAKVLGFNDSSTDRNRVAAAMMEEPSLPEAGSEGYAVNPGVESQDQTVAQAFVYEEQPIDRPLAESTGDDGATVVGYEDDGGDILDQQTLAQPVAEDGAALSDFGRQEGESPGLIPLAHSAAFRDDSDAATIIPDMPGPGMFDTSEWAPDPVAGDASDATLLDGVNAADVHAAVAHARSVAEAMPTGQTPPGSSEVAPRLDSLAMEALVLDSVQTGKGPAADPAALGLSPKPLEGPIRVAPDERPPGAVGPGAIAQPPSLSPAPGHLAPQEASAPQHALRLPSPPASSPALPDADKARVGDSTGRWMAGQLDAGALAWDDDAAARRAVATRNQPGGGAVPGSLPPGPVSPEAPFGQSSAPHPGVAAGAQYQPAPHPGFFARNGMLIVTLALTGVLLAGVGYAWVFTQVFWPKLTLESDPTGAMVVVDGSEYPGNTPLKIQIEPRKKHTIEFRKAGFKVTTHEITDAVTQLGNYRLKATLAPSARQVHLPVEGTVFINGAAVATGQEITLSKLPDSGTVTLRVEAKGYRPYEAVFQDAESIPTSLDVPLSPL